MRPEPESSSCNTPPSPLLPATTSRDWFFPSPSTFVHQDYPLRPRTSRRFSTTLPKAASSAASAPPPPPPYPRFRRRRVHFPHHLSPKPEHSVSSSAPLPQEEAVHHTKTALKKKPSARFAYFGVQLPNRFTRSHFAVSASFLVTILASLMHKNFSLRNQVIDLQDEISRLNGRLRACDMYSSIDSPSMENVIDDLHVGQGLKHLSLIASLSILSIPILIFKYIDHVSKSRASDVAPEEVCLSKRLAYRLDVSLSVHPYAKPLALLVATLLLICLGGFALFGVTQDGLADCLWLSWTYVADSGNHADSEGIGPRLVSVSISFGGMLIFAMMLGLVSDSISEKFDSLRKGRSEVVEQNHTLILGWSDKLGSLLNQLAIANDSLGGGTIVVMAERDKEEMELDIGKMEFDFKGTSVICRSGSPLILADLKKVSVSKARAIIVLAEDGNADQSDARALRTVLSLTGVKEGLRGHIVVELSDLDNEVLVKLVGGDLVETVVAHDVIGRLMIQCARQPGLAQIWEDILGFENCEFYIKRWPQLDGLQFEDVLISFPDAIPCGIKVASCGGKIVLNPDDSYSLQEGDEVLVIAEDDDTYAPAALPTVNEASFVNFDRTTRKPQKILLCGWRRDIDDMIVVSSFFKAPNSFFSSPECCRYGGEVCPKTSMCQRLQKGYYSVVGDEIWKILSWCWMPFSHPVLSSGCSMMFLRTTGKRSLSTVVSTSAGW
ncbi:Ion channel CASTOR [Linum grandiflorum]